MKVIKLQPFNCITGQQSKRAVYFDYLVWRKSDGYKLWLKKQWARQDAKCYWCKCSLVGRQHNVDHVLAISKQGTNRTKNFVLSCAPCNKAKGSKKVSRKVQVVATRFNTPPRPKRSKEAKAKRAEQRRRYTQGWLYR